MIGRVFVPLRALHIFQCFLSKLFLNHMTQVTAQSDCRSRPNKDNPISCVCPRITTPRDGAYPSHARIGGRSSRLAVVGWSQIRRHDTFASRDKRTHATRYNTVTIQSLDVDQKQSRREGVLIGDSRGRKNTLTEACVRNQPFGGFWTA